MHIPEPIQDLHNLRLIRGKRYWKPFMEKYDCKVICEVGVFAGRNFVRMIEHRPDLAVAVDIWREDGNFAHNDSDFSQQDLDREYKNFTIRMSDKPFVQIYREYSIDAVNHFPDNYFDLIYIDGDHTYQGSLLDIKSWYPKIKRDKFLTGDDYVRTIDPVGIKYDVKKAVNDFAQENNLDAYEIPGNEWATGWAMIKK